MLDDLLLLESKHVEHHPVPREVVFALRDDVIAVGEDAGSPHRCSARSAQQHSRECVAAIGNPRIVLDELSRADDTESTLILGLNAFQECANRVDPLVLVGHLRPDKVTGQ
jgi:hypothetical protein